MVTIVKLDPTSTQEILPVVRRFNEACNYASRIAFDEQLWYWLPLQRRLYYEIRQKFDLSSKATSVLMRKVAATYHDRHKRGAVSTFNPLGGIPLFHHSYKKDGTVMFYGLRVKIADSRVLTLSGKKEAMLVFRDGCFYIHQVVNVSEPTPYTSDSYLGVDLGIVNILADSDGKRYSGAHFNNLRRRHSKLRARLQSKGTKSAKRLLKKRNRKETRFARSVNHAIAKTVVKKAKDTGRGIALEDLGGIRDRTTVRKAQRAQRSSWSFFQLRFFLEYKSRLAGVPVIAVDPRNTSRTCPGCGHVAKENRKNQSEFVCVRCRFSANADHVAALNIAVKAERLQGGVVGDQPDAEGASPSASVATTYVSSPCHLEILKKDGLSPEDEQD